MDGYPPKNPFEIRETHLPDRHDGDNKLPPTDPSSPLPAGAAAPAISAGAAGFAVPESDPEPAPVQTAVPDASQTGIFTTCWKW